MIFITGCARSGTSLTTAVLRACGANLGEGKINGLNEHLGVRENVVKPYLKSIGVDPLGQYPLPDWTDVAPDPDWREKVEAEMGHPAEPWTYKCAKACLFWWLWAGHFPGAKWVIVRRDREKIVDSCLRTKFMRAYTDRAGWGAWVDHHLDRFEEMKADLDCIEVWPNEAMGDPDVFLPVVEHCGLIWDRDAVAAVIDPERWHG